MGYLRLLDLPLIITAVGDIVAGCVVVAALPGRSPGPLDVALLVVSSACLFGAGAVSRACFQFEDERSPAPRGPLHTGVATPKGAFILATCLSAAGILAAMCVGKTSVYLAWALLFLHWLHGGYLRDLDVTGPVAMSLTRVLNLLLGMSPAEELLYSLGRPEVMVPSGVLLVYMVLIGIIGRLKDEGGTRFTLLVSGGGLAVTLVAAAVFYWYRAGSTFAVAMLMMVAASLAVPALYAVLHLSPRAIARLVAVGILAAALMDASFIFGASKGEGLRLSEGLWGLFTIALICPAALFMRMLPPPEPPPELPVSPFAGGVRAGSL